MGFWEVIRYIAYFLSIYFAVFWFLVFLEEGSKKNRKKKLRELPFVSLAIPAWNEESTIRQTIESAFSLDYPKNKFEIIIINDGSSDNTPKIISEIIKKNKKYNIVFINKKKNEGKAKGLNDALKIAKGEFFVCLDADAFVAPDALKNLLSYFTSKTIAVVLPLMKVKNPQTLIQKIQWYDYIINMFYKSLMSKLDCVHVSPGPFSVFRKDVIVELGGYDESTITEDLELTLRLQKHHYRIIQTTDAEVYTVAPKNLKGMVRQRNRWFKGSFLNIMKYKKLVLNKRYGDFGAIQAPTMILSGILAITLIASFFYYLFKPLINLFRNLALINFDVFTLLKNLKISDINLLDVNIQIISLFLLMFFISLSIFRIAHVTAREKIFIRGIFAPIIFIFVFFMISGSVWAQVFVELIFGKVQKWHK